MSEETTGKVTYDGERLIKRWMETKRLSEIALKEAAQRNKDLVEAERQLGAWLTPDDAREDEKFCVWYGDSLIAAKVYRVNGPSLYSVEIRTRGRNFF